MTKLNASWRKVDTIGSKQFCCGHCGSNVTTNMGYNAFNSNNVEVATLHLCHFCNRLSAFDSEIQQIPSPMIGRNIDKLPGDVELLYNEIRRASSVGAYSLVLLGGRKLLMHIAVSLNAKENLKFIQYVNFLEENHFTPPKSSAWVTKIKDMGNVANHEVELASEENANLMIKFLDLLMTFNYEFADDIHELTENSEKTE